MIITKISCPEYNFNSVLNINNVSHKIDEALSNNFSGRSVVLRAVQSEKHTLNRDDLIEHIIKTGTDRYEDSTINSVNVSDTKIDLFGIKCTVKGEISLPILKGFHVYKPKSLERPQCRLDIWMVYDAEKLKNVEYFHKTYGVITKDGYIFKNENNKIKALIGLIILE